MTYNHFLQETVGFIGKSNENFLGIFLTTPFKTAMMYISS
jgi:hypothetical protein